MNKSFWTLRIIWLGGVVALLSWLTWQWLVPRGVWQTTRVFPGSDRRISELFPAERIADAKTILVEPVYFQVRVPQELKTAEVALTYENPGRLTWRLGVREQLNAWQWRLVEPATTKKLEDGRLLSVLSLPLSGIVLDKGSYAFILSVPELGDKGGRFTVEELQIIFKK